MDGSYEPSIFDIGLVSQSSINGSDCNEMQYKGVRYDKLSTEDLKGQEFKTVEEAESFYNAYAKAMGFDVRSDYKRLSIRITGRVTSLRLVCSAQGKRREEYMSNKKRVRKPKKETRFNCPCLFKVRYRSNINAYIVEDFITIHSHQLAQAHESHLLQSHRSVEDHHLALATSMQRVSIKPCHTYEYIVDRSGGFKNVGFIMKDLYNKLDSRRREILLEGDAEAALAYMRGKVATDSHFYCKFSIDEDNRLANMFWRDSNSLVDYTCFGDVLVFDSTYKTNPYEKPLVLFVGSNNHLSTTVFGFALLMDETIETYTVTHGFWRPLYRL
ncbi:protein FAR1-RELATED SEQUENCE 5-like [Rosa chinensis]|uniref:protein FAR1-RELATED SEQUENCE 5-like n=1 Tax=Rosa chinensis TaxID=74649 RepID=UPI000D08944E|nr:protein FAR1-RELATED SEQUENCE 5-like [Rosa chinensis]